MSFQETAETLRSRLHLERFSPSALVLALIVGSVVLVCVSYSFVELVASHSFEVKKAQAAEEVSAIEGGEGQGLEESNQQPVSSEIMVHVSGCVALPGVYSLAEGSRVSDAVEAAGGFTEGAQMHAINLARILADEEQVHVPSSAVSAEGASESGTIPADQSARSSGRININTASVGELMELEGVGESTAEKIVRERSQNGSFKSVEDIKRVSGIGDKRFEAIKDAICV